MGKYNNKSNMDSPLRDMKYFDAFSGYGGFSLGIQQAYEGMRIENERQSEVSSPRDSEGQSRQQSHDGSERLTCIGFSEIDKYASQVYSKHFPTHKNYGDITKIHPQDIPDFDLLVGGFPCQAFSIAGKRAGFEDTRGTLIFDVLRILKEKHPRLVLLENVKGLLSHDGGRTFKTIITSLAELGYAVEWQVLNAKNFGVPQNRERVFIIGHLGGFGGRQVFPLTGDDRQDTESDGERSTEVFPTIRATHYKSGDNQPIVRIPEATKQGYAIAREGDSINLSVPNSKTRRGRVGGGIAQTLDTGMQQHTLNGSRIRRLTPTECERLMGLPDGWTEGVSDTQRYKLCGNGVVVNVVEEIVKRLIK